MLTLPHFRVKPPADTWTPPAPTAMDKWYDQTAQLIPHANSINLQTALDTYQVIRLEPKDYSANAAGTHPSVPLPPPFTLRTGQMIYGVGSATRLPNVTIEVGTSNATIRGCGGNFSFPTSSLVTRNVRIENTRIATITVTNTKLEDCVFSDLYLTTISIDTRSSGYVKNHKFIRQVNQNNNNCFTWLAAVGDTLSTGNLILWQNWLTPGGNKCRIVNVRDVKILHIDVESPFSNGSPAVDVSNADSLVFLCATGTNSTGELLKTTSVGAVGIGQLRGMNQQSGGTTVAIGAGTPIVAEVLHEVASDRTRTFPAGAVRSSGPQRVAVSPWTWVQTNAPTVADITAVYQATFSKTLTGIAWAPPTYVTPPTVPAGAALATTRADIQALLNSQGTVFLPAGKIVLDGPLLVGGGRRLIGSGMDQTFLVGVNSTVNLIQLDLSLPNGNRSLGPCLHLTDITLAGAKNGIWLESTLGTTGTGSNEFQMTDTVMERVCIRDMDECGLCFTNCFGFDNNHFGHVYFVNCADGFKHLATQPGATETNMYICYMDKSVFEDCQWLGCGRALNLYTTRASGGNMLLNCRIINSTVYAFRAQTYDSFNFFNCDFSNNAGGTEFGLAFAAVCPMLISHCRFTAGAANPTGLIDSSNVLFEGCAFARGGAASTVIRSANAIGLPGFGLANPANAAEYPLLRKVFINCDLTDMPLGTMPTVLGINNNSTADPTFQNDWCRRDNGTSYNFGAMSARSVGTRLLRNAT